jgi:hypothetical protein
MASCEAWITRLSGRLLRSRPSPAGEFSEGTIVQAAGRANL